ncbi:competence type IV pilus major pilin ComGC [Mitsuokella sp.]|uniref:competence type IV pilus major pilin ComGC n=1 Tax=Mitsuokella sp. TaxID=2049034 RepID=UPI003D7D9526
MKTKMTSRMRNNRQSKEAGFTLIGMLIAVGIVAILAMIAVPKFTSAIASANTAKIQSDLSTLDTAIAVYTIENGETPKQIAELEEYLQDKNVKPPTGDCYLQGEKKTVPDKEYKIEHGRAVCGTGNTTAAFFKKAKTAGADDSKKDDAGGGSNTEGQK